MTSRWSKFLLAIFSGILFGLLYGWVINPANGSEVTPSDLRIDYQTDFVLMIAETYHQNGDMDSALTRLASLGGNSALDTTLQALIFAQEIGYTQDDLGKMQNLLTAVQAFSFTQETSMP
jgi:hypothetical protein